MSAQLSVFTESKRTTRPPELKVDNSRQAGREAAIPSPAPPTDDALRAFLLPRTPSWALSSNTLKTDRPSSRRRERDEALKHKWVSFNTREYINVLTVDCDHADWPHYLKRLLEQGVPEPHLVVGTEGGTAQVSWVLAKGVRRDNPVQMRLYEGAYEALRTSLQGDAQFKGYLVKNPLHAMHGVLRFRAGTVELSDLLGPLIEWSGEKDYVLASRPRMDAQFEGRKPCIPAVPLTMQEAAGPKGSKVWEIGRQRCYRHRTSDPAIIAGILDEVAAELGSPIKPRTLQGMTKRISRWMAAHPNMLGTPACELRDIDHGVMTREAEERGQAWAWSNLDRTSKRVLAAERTNSIQHGRTAAAVVDAVARLWEGCEPITQAALAEAAGVCVRQIKRIWNESVTPPKGDIRSNPSFAPPGGLPQGEPLGGGNGGTLLLTLKQVSILSKERAKAARIRMEGEARAARDEAKRVAGLVLRYEAHAVAMGKRGVVPVVPPCLPWGTKGEGSPEVLAAYQAALDATADAGRRQEARVRKAQADERAAERRAMFRGWAEAGVREPFMAWMGQQGAWWDRITAGLTGDGLALKDMQRRTAFKRYWQDWREAMKGAGMVAPALPAARFRLVPDAVDIAMGATMQGATLPCNALSIALGISGPKVPGKPPILPYDAALPGQRIASATLRDGGLPRPDSGMRVPALVKRRFRTVMDAVDIAASLVEVAEDECADLAA